MQHKTFQYHFITFHSISLKSYLLINCCLEIPGCADKPEALSSIYSCPDESIKSDIFVIDVIAERLLSSFLCITIPCKEGGKDTFCALLAIDWGSGVDGNKGGLL